MPFFPKTSNYGKSYYILLRTASRFFQKHKELTMILFLSFAMKYFLADWNSYWLDELYSVYERGIMFDHALEVLYYHQGRSMGMPLYEFILFNWMQLFGHSEVATRMLSTLYVTLSILFFYLFALRTFGRRVAVAASLLYTFSYMAVYHSLEARYYAQSLFLCALSSYLLVLYLESLTGNYSWRRLLFNKHFILLTLANVALMLTFPFNYLFLMAQGIFVLGYFLNQNRPFKILDNLGKVFVLYFLQLTAMGIIWDFAIFREVGRFFIGAITPVFTFNNFGHSTGIAAQNFAAPGSTSFTSFKNPLTMLMENVVVLNLDLPLYLYIVIFMLVIITSVKYARKLYKRKLSSIFPPRSIYFFYIILWFFLPGLLSFFIFSLGQFDQFWPRYLVFCTPPLMLLVALALEQGISLLDRPGKKLLRFSLQRHYLRYSLIYAIVFSIWLTLPGGYEAATYQKEDWRGVASQVVETIHRDPEHQYIVFETAFRKPHTLDYYFKQFSDKVRVYDLIQRYEERRLREGKDYTPRFRRAEAIREIEKHDYLLVAFTHHTENDFPQVLKLLSENYELKGSYLDDEGRGYMIYRAEHDCRHAAYKEEKVSGGLKFNAIDNDYVDFNFTPGFDADDSFTFELWLKLTGDLDSSTAIFGPLTNHDQAYGLHAYYKNRLSFGVRTEDDMARIDFESYLIDTWYHLAGVYNAEEKEGILYVDGELIGSDSLGGEATALSGESLGLNLPATIHGASEETDHLNMIITDVRVWGAVRTAEEIKENMFDRLTGTEKNLLGYWPLDEDTGNTVYDLTPNKNHGSIYGAKWQRTD